MKYIIANWKANKNYVEARDWIETFFQQNFTQLSAQVHIVICPPYPFIPFLFEAVKDRPYIKIGSQDVSVFEAGAYTGEVTAKSLSSIVDYSLIGHSERRQHFHETQEALLQKTKLANEHSITPLFCIRSTEDPIPDNVKFIVYEPVESIGTGNNAEVEQVLKVKEKLHITSSTQFIYGGSVTEENAGSYLSCPEIDGVLPGSASLDPLKFYKIVASTLKN